MLEQAKEKYTAEGALGILMGILNSLYGEVKILGGSWAVIHRLATPSGLETLRKIARVIVEDAKDEFKPFKNVLKVVVDYDKTLNQMFTAGKYDSEIDPDLIERRFPTKSKGREEISFELVHLDRQISSQDAGAELEKRGLRPATTEELLAFGAAYPDVQREFSVVALGTYAAATHGCECSYDTLLCYDWGLEGNIFTKQKKVFKRHVRRFCGNNNWSRTTRFLAVCK